MATLAGWVLADPIAGIDLTVDSGGQLRWIGPGAVAGSTLLAAAAAWALLALLERLTSRSHGTFTAIAVATLLLSLTGPLTAATDAASAVALTCLHLALATVLVPGLPAAASRAPAGLADPRAGCGGGRPESARIRTYLGGRYETAEWLSTVGGDPYWMSST
jgi:hypothetical protein